MVDEAVASGRFRPLWITFYKGALCNVGDQEARINPYARRFRPDQLIQAEHRVGIILSGTWKARRYTRLDEAELDGGRVETTEDLHGLAPILYMHTY